MSMLPRRRLSSRWRLNLSVLAALVIVLVAGGWIAVEIVKSRFISQMDEDLREAATEMSVGYQLLGPDGLAELGQLAAIGPRRDVAMILGGDDIVVTWPSGAVDDPDPLPAVGPDDVAHLRGQAWEPFDVGNVEGGSPRYRAVAAPLEDGNLVVVASPLGRVDQAARTVLRVLLVVSATAAAVLMTLVSWISRRSIRPVEQMITTAQTVGAGQLDTRLELDSPNPDVARLAQALNAMLERLQQAFTDKERSEERLRRFVADASHELRTPLAAILGYTDLYQHGVSRSGEQVEHAMERITVEGRRMQSLVEELLMLARLEQGAPTERTAVDMAELAHEAVRRAQAVDPTRPITLDVDASGGNDGGPLMVEGDPVALTRVLDNLLANVRAHTSEGTRATVQVSRQHGDVAIEVADNGPGMPTEDAARAFDRFYRAEPSRSRPGGSGLGLAIVHAIVRSHDGTVDLETAPGEGAAFTVRLPVARSGIAPRDTLTRNP